MVQSQFSLSWDSYKSSICMGFSSLQQNGEFVDMTLAADGYYVKVHQVLMALASPYLKELISSAPCQHPVVFLNNVSHKTLSSLLEYIYTGEVLIPSENLLSFAETAKSLHIKGLESITNKDSITVKMAENMSPIDGEMGHVSGTKRVDVPVNDKLEQVSLPAAARKICIKQEPVSAPKVSARRTPRRTKAVSSSSKNMPHDYDTMILDDTLTHDDDDDMPLSYDYNSETSDVKSSSLVEKSSTSNLQFSVSIRGSLQVILNRYIYNLNSRSIRDGVGVRRWRCVDYRNHKCMAFVVTKGNVVLNRANLHNHPFHDKKILAKVENKCVYSAIEEVKGYQEQEESKVTDTQDFMTVGTFSDIGDKSSDFIRET